jgi:hypothetical protein
MPSRDACACRAPRPLARGAALMRAAALGLLCWLACGSLAHADERILSYDSTITIQPDGALDVHEVIRVRAEGRQIKRGIYRDFPTIYPGRNGTTVSVGFDFRSARRDGAAEEWHTESRGNGVRIYLGNARSAASMLNTASARTATTSFATRAPPSSASAAWHSCSSTTLRSGTK